MMKGSENNNRSALESRDSIVDKNGEIREQIKFMTDKVKDFA